MTTFESPGFTLDEFGRAALFTEARTANTFSPEPVSDAELTEIWELARWAPTSANVQPLRVTYLRTPEAKERLVPLMSEGNRDKTRSAPVVAILAADLDFHELIPRTFPSRPQLKEMFADEARRHPAARFNATLQAGYLILAVRAVGLAAGPMLGYDGPAIDREFFSGTSLSTVLVVNIGHPGDNPWFERLPRLPHDEVVRFL
jgi:3-hydroxypropanoate dehydrogenase